MTNITPDQVRQQEEKLDDVEHALTEAFQRLHEVSKFLGENDLPPRIAEDVGRARESSGAALALVGQFVLPALRSYLKRMR